MLNEQPLKINWRIINALRGFAALGVVVNHARGLLFSDDVLYATHVHPKQSWQIWEWVLMLATQFATLGSEFVILFFVLSGFSIAHSLSANVDTVGFYKRRLVRLYPTYVIGLVWALVVFWLIRFFCPDVFFKSIDGNTPVQEYYQRFISLKNVLLSVVYIHQENYLTHQYWSLPLEVLFYLAAPFIIRKMKVWGIVTVLIYTAFLLYDGIVYRDPDDSNVFLQLFADYGVYFLLGVLFNKYRNILVKSFPMGKVAWIVFAFVFFVLMILVKGYVFHEKTNKITGAMTAVFAYWLLFGAIRHNFVVGWLNDIGHYSYTLYVTHLATIFCIKIATYHFGMGFYLIDNLLVWYAGILLSLAVAYGLYFLAERPSIKLLEKMRNK